MQPQSMLSIWGQRPVLVLVGVRLGLDRFNPVYYDAVKVRNFFLTDESSIDWQLIIRNFIGFPNLLVYPVADLRRRTILLAYRETIYSTWILIIHVKLCLIDLHRQIVAPP